VFPAAVVAPAGLAAPRWRASSRAASGTSSSSMGAARLAPAAGVSRTGIFRISGLRIARDRTGLFVASLRHAHSDGCFEEL